jgi:hypothetical protein
MGLETDATQCHGVLEGYNALGHEGVGHGDVELGGEVGELSPGLGADYPVTGEDDGVTGLGDKFGRRGHPVVGGLRHGGLLGPQGLGVDLHLRQVFRELDETGPGLFRLRQFEGLADYLGDHIGGEYPRGVFADRGEDVLQIQHLMGFFMEAIGVRLTGDGHQRRMVHIGIRHPGDQIGGAGPQGR